MARQCCQLWVGNGRCGCTADCKVDTSSPILVVWLHHSDLFVMNVSTSILKKPACVDWVLIMSLGDSLGYGHFSPEYPDMLLLRPSCGFRGARKGLPKFSRFVPGRMDFEVVLIIHRRLPVFKRCILNAALTNTSLLLLYHRIFGVVKIIRIALWISAFFVLGYWIATTILSFSGLHSFRLQLGQEDTRALC